jgi:hypothetical protein
MGMQNECQEKTLNKEGFLLLKNAGISCTDTRHYKKKIFIRQ